MQKSMFLKIIAEVFNDEIYKNAKYQVFIFVNKFLEYPNFA